MLKVIEKYNIGFATQNVFLRFCKINVLIMLINKMSIVAYNLFILRIYRKV